MMKTLRKTKQTIKGREPTTLDFLSKSLTPLMPPISYVLVISLETSISDDVLNPAIMKQLYL